MHCLYCWLYCLSGEMNVCAFCGEKRVCCMYRLLREKCVLCVQKKSVFCVLREKCVLYIYYLLREKCVLCVKRKVCSVC